ncbi:MAG: DUF2157 domain-containing protein [Betaproteobacteria bacterium]|nr:DUF2157 domain-containing protein [Betaproteobacteria bacterium]
MDIHSRVEAQQRADEIRVFQRELERLEHERVIALDDAQRAAIECHHQELLARYGKAFDIDHDAHAKQLSLGMRIASFIGALALAASVFFLFYQFWGRFSTAAQVAILLIAAFGALAATVLVQGRDETGYFTKLAAMVAFVCFVLNIAMLGRIFNLTPTDNALLPWAAFALLLAYTCDLRLLLVAGILCFASFIAARTGTFGGLYWLDFGERPENFFPAAVALFLLPQVVDHRRFAGFAATYRLFGVLTLLLPVLVLSHWGSISYVHADPDVIEGGYQVLGFTLAAGLAWLGARRRWPEVTNTGVTFFVIFLYTKFFDWWWDAMPKYLFFLVLGLTAVLFLLVLRRLRARGYRIFGGGG